MTDLLTTREAARLLGLPPKTFMKRVERRGAPKPAKVAAPSYLWDREDIEAMKAGTK